MNTLQVSLSPHITAKPTTGSIMIEVCIGLLPAVVASVVFFGFYALFLLILSVGSCVFGEFIFNVIRKKQQTVKDCSCIVTGILLGLSLPAGVPFYVPIIGGIFAIIVVKMLFGGIGHNFANPAITGRIFVLLAWTGFLTSFVAPISWANGEAFKYFSCILKGADGVTAVTTATPLDGGTVNYLQMFLGNIGGCIGETSSLALLLGGAYLIIRRIIDWKIPLIYIGTTLLFSIIFGGIADVPLAFLGGSLLMGAFFMATDYSTSPNSFWGTIIFAFGCGFITALIRYFGNYPEGVSFAILLMNIVVPLLDKYIKPRPFGFVKRKKSEVKSTK